MATPSGVDTEKMIFRGTHAIVGRHVSITPQNSGMKHLSYGRVILNSSAPKVIFNNGGCETALICLSGRAAVRAAGQEFALGQYDSLYVPRDSSIEVSAKKEADLAEFSCDVQGKYPAAFVPYLETSQKEGMKFSTGGPGCSREVNILMGKNVEAGRILAGFTRSDLGNWTSWPPHEHAKLLEEVYVYFDMPEPAYGVQLVYTNAESPELVTVVREGDAVLIPGGYHPNVAVPGHRIAFLWAMAAHREVQDRQYGVVNIQPGFQQGGSEAIRKK